MSSSFIHVVCIRMSLLCSGCIVFHTDISHLAYELTSWWALSFFPVSGWHTQCCGCTRACPSVGGISTFIQLLLGTSVGSWGTSATELVVEWGYCPWVGRPYSEVLVRAGVWVPGHPLERGTVGPLGLYSTRFLRVRQTTQAGREVWETTYRQP